MPPAATLFAGKYSGGQVHSSLVALQLAVAWSNCRGQVVGVSPSLHTFSAKGLPRSDPHQVTLTFGDVRPRLRPGSARSSSRPRIGSKRALAHMLTRSHARMPALRPCLRPRPRGAAPENAAATCLRLRVVLGSCSAAGGPRDAR